MQQMMVIVAKRSEAIPPPLCLLDLLHNIMVVVY